MPARPSWKGHLRLSLISIPIQAYSTLTEGGGKLHFRQLHGECNSPIQYKKVCPIHGEVSADQIVMGYEYEKDKFALLDRDELGKGTRDRTMTVDAFVAPEKIDPLHWDGSHFYLVPDGKIGQQPYSVLHRALVERGRWGIGEAVMGDKEQLMLLRPVDDMLCLTSLHYASRIRAADAIVEGRLETKAPKADEVKLAEMLIDAATPEKFDLSQYEDDYTERMQRVIEAKIEGKEVAAPEVEEQPRVINLMDALKKSVARMKQGHAEPQAPPPKAAGKSAKRRNPANTPRRAPAGPGKRTHRAPPKRKTS